MLGLGETEEEVVKAMQDLRNVNCDFLTIGQYLAPSRLHHPVIEYIHPTMFEKLKLLALGMGFSHVASGPFVRSSYHAAEAL
jgi:lipoic acid synthetase